MINEPITQSVKLKDFFGTWQGDDLEKMIELVYKSRSTITQDYNQNASEFPSEIPSGQSSCYD